MSRDEFDDELESDRDDDTSDDETSFSFLSLVDHTRDTIRADDNEMI